jgi:hypothetical protein
MTDEAADDALPIPLGVRMDTGRPLAALREDTIWSTLESARKQLPVAGRHAAGVESDRDAFALIGGIDQSDLSQTGWGVIYAPEVGPEVKDALRPLLEHRQAQSGTLFHVFDGPEGFLSGDTAESWLGRRRVRMDVVDPDNGVPFYLLLIGSPAQMPFEFQYSLDYYWAVGRLWFDSPDEFRRYAESVIAYEQPGSPVPTRRRGAIFAPEHDFDEATQLFSRQVAQPLAHDADGALPKLWKSTQFALDDYLGARAHKAALADLLRGKAGGTPALVITGSHGIECPLDDPQQTQVQGALVCQDWTGYGAIGPEHCFAAADLPADARLSGVMHIFFACYSAGCTEFDNYDRLNAEPRKIANAPFMSRLPQAMLSHSSGGALAVLAHVERAWAYSFRGRRGSPQIQGFRDVIARLLRGERIGQATDQFNLRWGSISNEIAELQAGLALGAEPAPRRLANLWISRDDARNFVILGDPAVRLRVEDMAIA